MVWNTKVGVEIHTIKWDIDETLNACQFVVMWNHKQSLRPSLGENRLIARENLAKLCLMYIFMSFRCGYVQLADTVCYAGCMVAFVQCTLRQETSDKIQNALGSKTTKVSKFICVYLRAKSFWLTCLLLSTTFVVVPQLTRPHPYTPHCPFNSSNKSI